MSGFSDWLQRTAQKIPGNNFAQTRFGDILTGGIARAVNRNEWRIPGTSDHRSDQTSIDDIAGIGSGNSSIFRGIARGVGAGFGGYGLYSLGSGLGGPTEVGQGFPLAEEAGGAGPGGQLSGPGQTMGISDYAQKYGRQGMNLLNQMGGMGGGAAPIAGAVDNSMIAPLKIDDPYKQEDQINPGILAMLIAQMQQGSYQAPEADSPYVSGRGLA